MYLFTYKPYIRIISILVVVCFILVDVSYAFPQGSSTPSSSVLNTKVSNNSPLDITSIKVPYDHASIESFHKGHNGKTLIHIQDAHSNYSGQKNIASTLKELIDEYSIDTVLVEGGYGDVSLNELKSIASKKDWDIVANKFLMKSLITGPEYLNLTTNLKLKLLGLEDKDLYESNVLAYSKIKDKRQSIKDFLHSIQVSLDRLKYKLYPKRLIDYEETKDPKDFTTHFNTLLELIDSTPLEDLNLYPNIKKLKELTQKEDTLDFTSINKDQKSLWNELNKLYPKDKQTELTHFFKSTPKSHYATRLLLEELITKAKEVGIPIARYPYLLSYLLYLEEFNTLKMDTLMQELESLEDHMYGYVIDQVDTKKLRAIDRYLNLVRKAYDIKLTTNDYKMLKYNEPIFKTKDWMRFINQKLTQIDYKDNLLTYKPLLENSHSHIIDFYTLVEDRDKTFLHNTNTYLKDQNKNKAFIITGGYHTEHLTHLLKKEGYSLLTLTPNIEHHTDQSLYEKILLSTIDKYKTPSSNNKPIQLAKAKHQDYVAQLAARLALEDRASEMASLADGRLNTEDLQGVVGSRFSTKGGKSEVDRPTSLQDLMNSFIYQNDQGILHILKEHYEYQSESLLRLYYELEHLHQKLSGLQTNLPTDHVQIVEYRLSMLLRRLERILDAYKIDKDSSDYNRLRNHQANVFHVMQRRNDGDDFKASLSLPITLDGKKIATILNEGGLEGGIVSYTRQLAFQIARRYKNTDHVIFYSTPHSVVSEQVVIGTNTITFVPYKDQNTIRNLLIINQTKTQREFDLIISPYPAFPTHHKIAKLFDLPIIGYAHANLMDFPDYHDEFQNNFREANESWRNGQYTTRILSVSNAVKKSLEELYLIDSQVVGPIIDAITFDKVKADPDQVEELRRSFDLSPDDAVILVPIRIDSNKNPMMALRAFETISSNYQHARLVFVGPYEDEDQYLREGMQQFISKSSLDGRVSIVGSVDPSILRQWYGLSEMVVLPSSSEGFGLVLAEAGLMEKAVIAFDHAAIQEVVQHNATGLLVEFSDGEDDVESLAKAMSELLNHPQKAKEMGRKGRLHIIKNYHPDQLLDAHFLELEDVLYEHNPLGISDSTPLTTDQKEPGFQGSRAAISDAEKARPSKTSELDNVKSKEFNHLMPPWNEKGPFKIADLAENIGNLRYKVLKPFLWSTIINSVLIVAPFIISSIADLLFFTSIVFPIIPIYIPFIFKATAIIMDAFIAPASLAMMIVNGMQAYFLRNDFDRFHYVGLRQQTKDATVAMVTFKKFEIYAIIVLAPILIAINVVAWSYVVGVLNNIAVGIGVGIIIAAIFSFFVMKRFYNSFKGLTNIRAITELVDAKLTNHHRLNSYRNAHEESFFVHEEGGYRMEVQYLDRGKEQSVRFYKIDRGQITDNERDYINALVLRMAKELSMKISVEQSRISTDKTIIQYKFVIKDPSANTGRYGGARLAINRQDRMISHSTNAQGTWEEVMQEWEIADVKYSAEGMQQANITGTSDSSLQTDEFGKNPNWIYAVENRGSGKTVYLGPADVVQLFPSQGKRIEDLRREKQAELNFYQEKLISIMRIHRILGAIVNDEISYLSANPKEISDHHFLLIDNSFSYALEVWKNQVNSGVDAEEFLKIIDDLIKLNALIAEGRFKLIRSEDRRYLQDLIGRLEREELLDLQDIQFATSLHDRMSGLQRELQEQATGWALGRASAVNPQQQAKTPAYHANVWAANWLRERVIKAGTEPLILDIGANHSVLWRVLGQVLPPEKQFLSNRVIDFEKDKAIYDQAPNPNRVHADIGREHFGNLPEVKNSTSELAGKLVESSHNFDVLHASFVLDQLKPDELRNAIATFEELLALPPKDDKGNRDPPILIISSPENSPIDGSPMQGALLELGYEIVDSRSNISNSLTDEVKVRIQGNFGKKMLRSVEDVISKPFHIAIYRKVHSVDTNRIRKMPLTRFAIKHDQDNSWVLAGTEKPISRINTALLGQLDVIASLGANDFQSKVAEEAFYSRQLLLTDPRFDSFDGQMASVMLLFKYMYRKNRGISRPIIAKWMGERSGMFSESEVSTIVDFATNPKKGLPFHRVIDLDDLSHLRPLFEQEREREYRREQKEISRRQLPKKLEDVTYRRLNRRLDNKRYSLYDIYLKEVEYRSLKGLPLTIEEINGSQNISFTSNTHNRKLVEQEGSRMSIEWTKNQMYRAYKDLYASGFVDWQTFEDRTHGDELEKSERDKWYKIRDEARSILNSDLERNELTDVTFFKLIEFFNQKWITPLNLLWIVDRESDNSLHLRTARLVYPTVLEEVRGKMVPIYFADRSMQGLLAVWDSYINSIVIDAHNLKEFINLPIAESQEELSSDEDLKKARLDYVLREELRHAFDGIVVGREVFDSYWEIRDDARESLQVLLKDDDASHPTRGLLINLLRHDFESGQLQNLLDQMRWIIYEGIIELSGQLAAGAWSSYGAERTLKRWIVSYSNSQSNPDIFWTADYMAMQLGILLLAQELGIFTGELSIEEVENYLNESPSHDVFRQIIETPTEELRSAMQEVYNRQYTSSLEVSPFNAWIQYDDIVSAGEEGLGSRMAQAKTRRGFFAVISAFFAAIFSLGVIFTSKDNSVTEEDIVEAIRVFALEFYNEKAGKYDMISEGDIDRIEYEPKYQRATVHLKNERKYLFGFDSNLKEVFPYSPLYDFWDTPLIPESEDVAKEMKLLRLENPDIKIYNLENIPDALQRIKELRDILRLVRKKYPRILSKTKRIVFQYDDKSRRYFNTSIPLGSSGNDVWTQAVYIGTKHFDGSDSTTYAGLDLLDAAPDEAKNSLAYIVLHELCHTPQMDIEKTVEGIGEINALYRSYITPYLEKTLPSLRGVMPNTGQEFLTDDLASYLFLGKPLEQWKVISSGAVELNNITENPIADITDSLEERAVALEKIRKHWADDGARLSWKKDIVGIAGQFVFIAAVIGFAVLTAPFFGGAYWAPLLLALVTRFFAPRIYKHLFSGVLHHEKAYLSWPGTNVKKSNASRMTSSNDLESELYSLGVRSHAVGPYEITRLRLILFRLVLFAHEFNVFRRRFTKRLVSWGFNSSFVKQYATQAIWQGWTSFDLVVRQFSSYQSEQVLNRLQEMGYSKEVLLQAIQGDEPQIESAIDVLVKTAENNLRFYDAEELPVYRRGSRDSLDAWRIAIDEVYINTLIYNLKEELTPGISAKNKSQLLFFAFVRIFFNRRKFISAAQADSHYNINPYFAKAFPSKMGLQWVIAHEYDHNMVRAIRGQLSSKEAFELLGDVHGFAHLSSLYGMNSSRYLAQLDRLYSDQIISRSGIEYSKSRKGLKNLVQLADEKGVEIDWLLIHKEFVKGYVLSDDITSSRRGGNDLDALLGYIRSHIDLQESKQDLLEAKDHNNRGARAAQKKYRDTRRSNEVQTNDGRSIKSAILEFGGRLYSARNVVEAIGQSVAIKELNDAQARFLNRLAEGIDDALAVFDDFDQYVAFIKSRSKLPIAPLAGTFIKEKVLIFPAIFMKPSLLAHELLHVIQRREQAVAGVYSLIMKILDDAGLENIAQELIAWQSKILVTHNIKFVDWEFGASIFEILFELETNEENVLYSLAEYAEMPTDSAPRKQMDSAIRYYESEGRPIGGDHSARPHIRSFLDKVEQLESPDIKMKIYGALRDYYLDLDPNIPIPVRLTEGARAANSDDSDEANEPSKTDSDDDLAQVGLIGSSDNFYFYSLREMGAELLAQKKIMRWFVENLKIIWLNITVYWTSRSQSRLNFLDVGWSIIASIFNLSRYHSINGGQYQADYLALKDIESGEWAGGIYYTYSTDDSRSTYELHMLSVRGRYRQKSAFRELMDLFANQVYIPELKKQPIQAIQILFQTRDFNRATLFTQAAARRIAEINTGWGNNKIQFESQNFYNFLMEGLIVTLEATKSSGSRAAQDNDREVEVSTKRYYHLTDVANLELITNYGFWLARDRQTLGEVEAYLDEAGKWAPTAVVLVLDVPQDISWTSKRTKDIRLPNELRMILEERIEKLNSDSSVSWARRLLNRFLKQKTFESEAFSDRALALLDYEKRGNLLHFPADVINVRETLLENKARVSPDVFAELARIFTPIDNIKDGSIRSKKQSGGARLGLRREKVDAVADQLRSARDEVLSLIIKRGLANRSYRTQLKELHYTSRDGWRLYDRGRTYFVFIHSEYPNLVFKIPKNSEEYDAPNLKNFVMLAAKFGFNLEEVDGFQLIRSNTPLVSKIFWDELLIEKRMKPGAFFVRSVIEKMNRITNTEGIIPRLEVRKNNFGTQNGKKLYIDSHLNINESTVHLWEDDLQEQINPLESIDSSLIKQFVDERKLQDQYKKNPLGILFQVAYQFEEKSIGQALNDAIATHLVNKQLMLKQQDGSRLETRKSNSVLDSSLESTAISPEDASRMSVGEESWAERRFDESSAHFLFGLVESWRKLTLGEELEEIQAVEMHQTFDGKSYTSLSSGERILEHNVRIRPGTNDIKTLGAFLGTAQNLRQHVFSEGSNQAAVFSQAVWDRDGEVHMASMMDNGRGFGEDAITIKEALKFGHGYGEGHGSGNALTNVANGATLTIIASNREVVYLLPKEFTDHLNDVDALNLQEHPDIDGHYFLQLPSNAIDGINGTLIVNLYYREMSREISGKHSGVTKIILEIASQVFGHDLNVALNQNVDNGARMAMRHADPRHKTEDVYSSFITNVLDGGLSTHEVTTESKKRWFLLQQLGPDIEGIVRREFNNQDIKIAVIPYGSTLKGYAGEKSDIEFMVLILDGLDGKVDTTTFEHQKERDAINNQIGELILSKGYKPEPIGPTIHPFLINFSGGIKTFVLHHPISEAQDERSYRDIAPIFLPIAYGDSSLLEKRRREALQFIKGRRIWSKIRSNINHHLEVSVPLVAKPYLNEWLSNLGVDIPYTVLSLNDFNIARHAELGFPDLETMLEVYGVAGTRVSIEDLKDNGQITFEKLYYWVDKEPEIMRDQFGLTEELIRAYEGMEEADDSSNDDHFERQMELIRPLFRQMIAELETSFYKVFTIYQVGVGGRPGQAQALLSIALDELGQMRSVGRIEFPVELKVVAMDPLALPLKDLQDDMQKNLDADGFELRESKGHQDLFGHTIGDSDLFNLYEHKDSQIMITIATQQMKIVDDVSARIEKLQKRYGMPDVAAFSDKHNPNWHASKGAWHPILSQTGLHQEKVRLIERATRNFFNIADKGTLLITEPLESLVDGAGNLAWQVFGHRSIEIVRDEEAPLFEKSHVSTGLYWKVRNEMHAWQPMFYSNTTIDHRSSQAVGVSLQDRLDKALPHFFHPQTSERYLVTNYMSGMEKDLDSAMRVVDFLLSSVVNPGDIPQSAIDAFNQIPAAKQKEGPKFKDYKSRRIAREAAIYSLYLYMSYLDRSVQEEVWEDLAVRLNREADEWVEQNNIQTADADDKESHIFNGIHLEREMILRKKLGHTESLSLFQTLRLFSLVYFNPKLNEMLQEPVDEAPTAEVAARSWAVTAGVDVLSRKIQKTSFVGVLLRPNTRTLGARSAKKTPNEVLASRMSTFNWGDKKRLLEESGDYTVIQDSINAGIIGEDAWRNTFDAEPELAEKYLMTLKASPSAISDIRQAFDLLGVDGSITIYDDEDQSALKRYPWDQIISSSGESILDRVTKLNQKLGRVVIRSIFKQDRNQFFLDATLSYFESADFQLKLEALANLLDGKGIPKQYLEKLWLGTKSLRLLSLVLKDSQIERMGEIDQLIRDFGFDPLKIWDFIKNPAANSVNLADLEQQALNNIKDMEWDSRSTIIQDDGAWLRRRIFNEVLYVLSSSLSKGISLEKRAYLLFEALVLAIFKNVYPDRFLAPFIGSATASHYYSKNYFAKMNSVEEVDFAIAHENRHRQIAVLANVSIESEEVMSDVAGAAFLQSVHGAEVANAIFRSIIDEDIVEGGIVEYETESHARARREILRLMDEVEDIDWIELNHSFTLSLIEREEAGRMESDEDFDLTVKILNEYIKKKTAASRMSAVNWGDEKRLPEEAAAHSWAGTSGVDILSKKIQRTSSVRVLPRRSKRALGARAAKKGIATSRKEDSTPVHRAGEPLDDSEVGLRPLSIDKMLASRLAKTSPGEPSDYRDPNLSESEHKAYLRLSDHLAQILIKHYRDQNTIAIIDGISGIGKTTFSEYLRKALERSHRAVAPVIALDDQLKSPTKRREELDKLYASFGGNLEGVSDNAIDRNYDSDGIRKRLRDIWGVGDKDQIIENEYATYFAEDQVEGVNIRIVNSEDKTHAKSKEGFLNRSRQQYKSDEDVSLDSEFMKKRAFLFDIDRKTSDKIMKRTAHLIDVVIDLAGKPEGWTITVLNEFTPAKPKELGARFTISNDAIEWDLSILRRLGILNEGNISNIWKAIDQIEHIENYSEDYNLDLRILVDQVVTGGEHSIIEGNNSDQLALDKVRDNMAILKLLTIGRLNKNAILPVVLTSDKIGQWIASGVSEEQIDIILRMFGASGYEIWIDGNPDDFSEKLQPYVNQSAIQHLSNAIRLDTLSNLEKIAIANGGKLPYGYQVALESSALTKDAILYEVMIALLKASHDELPRVLMRKPTLITFNNNWRKTRRPGSFEVAEASICYKFALLLVGALNNALSGHEMAKEMVGRSA